MLNSEPELRDLVDELDRRIPKAGARLKLPADQDLDTTVGTQLGYLRLGVEFLRAGLDPIADSPSEIPRIPLDIGYLLTPDSKTPFDLCEIDEEVERLPARARKLGALGQILTAVVTVALIGSLLVGAAAVFSWFFR
jgi:hypothetical protein